MNDDLWKKIKIARKDAGLTQEQLGLACTPTVTKSAVGQWESKNPKTRTKPDYKNLEAICSITGKPIEWFLGAKEYTQTATGGTSVGGSAETGHVAGDSDKNIVTNKDTDLSAEYRHAKVNTKRAINLLLSLSGKNQTIDHIIDLINSLDDDDLFEDFDNTNNDVKNKSA